MTELKSWIILIVRIPASPSRHRVAVWRELRKCGAVPVAQGAWAAPDVPLCRDAAERAKELAGAGEVIVLTASPTGSDAARLLELFDDARTEFLSDCGKFSAEIAREIGKGKFTLAELEEEEQSLERLRRWHRTIAGRDINGVPLSADARSALSACSAELDGYAELVYAEVHA